MNQTKSLKDRVTERPFGTLTKRELELLLLDFLISSAKLPKDPAGLSRVIRCTLSKSHAYLTDLALRKDPLNDVDAVNHLIAVLKAAEVSKDGQFIEFSVQDASLRLWIEQSLASEGLLQGQTFRRDLIKLSVKGVVTLAFSKGCLYSPKESLPRLKEAFGDAEWFREFERSTKKGVQWTSLLGGMSSGATILQLILELSK